MIVRQARDAERGEAVQDVDARDFVVERVDPMILEQDAFPLLDAVPGRQTRLGPIQSPKQLVWARFKQDKVALAGVVVIIVLTFLAVGAPWIASNIAHRGPNDISLAREMTDKGLPALGREFGGRNHATVLHAWKRVSELVDKPGEKRETVVGIRRRLEGERP